MSGRRDRLIQEQSHDPTRPSRKLQDPTVCPECEATYHAGRWTWSRGPADAARALCSACERIRDDYPAGFVTLRGAFVKEHRDEILALARNLEEREKRDHPLKRILAVSDEQDGSILVRTTEIHLARDIGNAVRRAYDGDLDVRYEEDVVRVDWVRES